MALPATTKARFRGPSAKMRSLGTASVDAAAPALPDPAPAMVARGREPAAKVDIRSAARGDLGIIDGVYLSFNVTSPLIYLNQYMALPAITKARF